MKLLCILNFQLKNSELGTAQPQLVYVYSCVSVRWYKFYVAFKFIIPATAFCDVLLNFGASQPRILSIVCSIHSITMGYYFIFTIFLRICVIGWSRNENSGDFALFKNHLDIFLSTVPDNQQSQVCLELWPPTVCWTRSPSWIRNDDFRDLVLIVLIV